MDLSNRLLIQFYANQFGPIRFRGKRYLKSIIEYYVKNDFVYDYDRLLAMVCEEFGLKRESIIRSVSRCIRQAWKQGFDWEWKNYVNWNQETPPTPSAAMQWLCENYVPFVDRFQDIIQTNQSYYLRLAVENSINKDEE